MIAKAGSSGMIKSAALNCNPIWLVWAGIPGTFNLVQRRPPAPAHEGGSQFCKRLYSIDGTHM